MASGIYSFAGLAKETTWGTPVASTAYLNFISESFTHEIEQLMEMEMRNIPDEPPQYEGANTVGGDITFAVRPATIGHILRSALGAPVTTGGPVYTHTFTPATTHFSSACSLPPYTFEIHRDLASAFQYAGCVVNELTIELSVGQKIMRATAAILGKSVTLITKTSSTVEASDPFLWKNASVTIGGVAKTPESFRVHIANNLEAFLLLNQTKEVGGILWNGHRVFDADVTFNVTDLTEYNLFKNQTESTCVIDINPDANTQLKFETNKLRYVAFPLNVGGPGRLTVAVAGKAKWDAALGAAMKVTLKNNVASY